MGAVSKFDLNPAVECLAVELAKTIGLDIPGVDLLFDGDHYWLFEVNCAPDFEGFKIATGINMLLDIYHYFLVQLDGVQSKTKII